MSDPLEIATRIVRLRAELAEAEAEFQRLVGGAARASRLPAASAPTAERVREALKSAGAGGLTYGELAAKVGAPREAIKSALKKSRGRGEVALRGERYRWK